ncbi:EAL domain-containing protein [Marinobacter sp. JSM 1782161]|uniref:bifunctional diguanylate cyclase/phosphodiesterase n=1 Tax=Marinobacter sp. JSM 1782161 TaxID=2685906 RepID=UPI001403BC40|nr:EAL domain-containing protein [Marinobacter sp. JSM 1782161]
MRRTRRGIISLQLLLLLFTSGLILLLMVASLVAGTAGFRGYIADQLEGHAHDGAVAVGLSLSNAIDGRDEVASSSLIDATFDSGRYLSIRYVNTASGFEISRRDRLRVPGAPDWFISLTDLPEERFLKRAEVVRGWQRLGYVEVVSHPGLGYGDLWRMTRRLALGALVIGGVSLVALFYLLRRALRPLAGLEEQAQAIRNRDFRYRAPEANTRELARVTSAMNQMTNDLGALFEGQGKLIQHLRRMSNEDRLTGLASRSAFEQRLRVVVESHESRRLGVLVLVQLAAFDKVNRFHGRKAADALLKEMAEALLAFLRQHPGSFAGRRAGAEFALFLPGAALVDAEFWVDELLETLDGIYADRSEGREVAVHAGLAVADVNVASARDLLSASDEALRQAQMSHETNRKVFDTAQSVQLGIDQWRLQLEAALDAEQVKLLFQSIQYTGNDRVHHYHVLSRLQVDGQWVAAGVFLPMAERFRLMAQLDDLVLRRVLALLKQHPLLAFGVTLGTSSIAERSFRERLGDLLQAEGQALLSRLWIYLPEDAVHHHRADVGACVKLLRRHDVKVLVDHFGVGGIPFSYLRNLPFQAMRIDPSFIHNIDSHADNRFYLESIVPIAHSRGVEVFVAGVETASEWQLVTQIGVDGGSGYHLARPDENLPPATL